MAFVDAPAEPPEATDAACFILESMSSQAGLSQSSSLPAKGIRVAFLLLMVLLHTLLLKTQHSIPRAALPKPMTALRLLQKAGFRAFKRSYSGMNEGFASIQPQTCTFPRTIQSNTMSPRLLSTAADASLDLEDGPTLLEAIKLFLARGALAMGAVYCVTEYIVDLTPCEGPSMLPTIQMSGEIMLIDKTIRYRQKKLSSGVDRVHNAKKQQKLFESVEGTSSKPCPWHESYISVTDLIALQPRVSWRDVLRHVCSPLSVGDVVVVLHPTRAGSTVCKRVAALPGDQVLLPRGCPQSKKRGNRSQQLLVVPDGHVWLHGDNPANSSDSRDYGSVPAAMIVGRVMTRIWPIRRGAWMRRGAGPTDIVPDAGRPSAVLLPAGYEGQPIRRTVQSNPKQ